MLGRSAIDAMVAQAEPVVLQCVRRSGVRRLDAMGPEDLAQELRIAVFELAQRWDPSRGTPWLAWVNQQLPRRVADFHRRHGQFRRSGTRRRMAAVRFSELEGDDGQTPDPVDERAAADALSLEWSDLRMRVESESPTLRAILLRCEGHTTGDVGRRLGVTQSCVSRWLSNDDGARSRLALLITGKLGVEQL